MFSPLQPFESAFSSIFKDSREKSQSSSTNVQPSSAVWEFNCTNLKILLRSCRLWLQLFTSLQPFESSMCWNVWVDGSQTVNYQEWQVSALKGNIRHRRNNTSFTLWCLQAGLADCRKLVGGKPFVAAWAVTSSIYLAFFRYRDAAFLTLVSSWFSKLLQLAGPKIVSNALLQLLWASWPNNMCFLLVFVASLHHLARKY